MPRKVLLMDEDNQVRTTVGAWLENQGYVAKLANSCEAAEYLAERELFDIVIVDMQWPGMTGIKCLTRFRERMPEALLVGLSEFADRELEQEARKGGASLCLTKPLNLEELRTVLDSPISPEPAASGNSFLPGKHIEQLLLRGFTPDQQWDFRMIGIVRTYQDGEPVPFNDEASSLLWVEQGRVGVHLNGILVETLGEGDCWGEESFVNPNPQQVQLLALDHSLIRQFNRRKIIDFFAYHDETLTKRYMINLILCLQMRCKRHLIRQVRGNPAARDPQG